MPFQNLLARVSCETWGSTVNGLTIHHLLGCISFFLSSSFYLHTRRRIRSPACEDGPSPALLCCPLLPIPLLSLFVSLFWVLSTYNRTGKNTMGTVSNDTKRGRQAKVPKCQMGCLTSVSSLGCDPGHSSPITVVPEGCTERDPTPMADVLPPGFILQCCLASWSKAPPWAKWLLELWFAKIQDVNLTVCYGYSALFQDVNLYLYSANQMLFRYCPS